MAAIGTYSIIGVTGTIVHPLVGSVLVGGAANGLATVTFSWDTERTSIHRMPDGTMITNVKRGDNGRAVLEIGQFCDADEFLLNWSNTIDTAVALNNVAIAALGSFVFSYTPTGDTWTGAGVSLAKKPDMVIGDDYAMRQWTFNVSQLVQD